ncbi:MAG: ECF transporter S component, partial [Prevotellaceae bacterium]|nr:ECF transporter S component [Prevotellaceae bacterium]
MVTTFNVSNLQFSSYRAYLWSAVFVLGNLLLPQLCHLTPYGGNILLPIYFFTLIAAYKFGWRVGLATAVLSPVVNSLLFSMPAAPVLPFILIKSVLLASTAALVAGKSKQI